MQFLNIFVSSLMLCGFGSAKTDAPSAPISGPSAEPVMGGEAPPPSLGYVSTLSYPDYIPTSAINSIETKYSQAQGYPEFIGGLVSNMLQHVSTQTHVNLATLAPGDPIPTEWVQVQSELQTVVASYVSGYPGNLFDEGVKASVIQDLQGIPIQTDVMSAPAEINPIDQTNHPASSVVEASTSAVLSGTVMASGSESGHVSTKASNYSGSESGSTSTSGYGSEETGSSMSLSAKTETNAASRATAVGAVMAGMAAMAAFV